ncbi:MAG: flagellar biosynthesis anti-sigma factor FlgM [Terriglobales bacterium]|jgi:flagellar biosynthesis anti-sigma factor FlgM
MRVDYTTFGTEPPDNSKLGRAGQTEAAETAVSNSLNDNNIPGVDQANFSSDQTQVQTLQAQVLAQPEVREAKVQSLQQAIGNGNYLVSAGQIADALVNEFSEAQG